MMTADLFERFEAFTSLISEGDRLILGVSGGADSLAMLHLFKRRFLDDLSRLFVVHVEHGIRAENSKADAEFVRRICAKWQIAYEIIAVDVPGLAKAEGIGLEVAARAARYRAFAEAARRQGAMQICVAHHADDQAETILLNLLRGAGLAGLRGMTVQTALSASHLVIDNPETRSILQGRPLWLLRPMLRFTRQEIERYCKEQDLRPRHDESNDDLSYSRNFIRLKVMPNLRALNPRLTEAFDRLSQAAQIDAAFVHAATEQALEDVVVEAADDFVSLSKLQWDALPLALRYGVLRLVTIRIGGEPLSFGQTERATQFIEDAETGQRIQLPGQTEISLEYDRIFIRQVDAQPRLPLWPLMFSPEPIDLIGFGTYSVGDDWTFTLSRYSGLRSGPQWDQLLADPWRSPLNGDELAFPLALRTRQRGDRFYPQGAGGQQKVGDFMTNAKISQQWRDQVPLLVAGEWIVWLCGWRVDQRFIVTDTTQLVWLASWQPTQSVNA
ncbi:MAG: tRNA lysidine(34) synthetase TilS [Chloroflexi bacterium]|nr:tRNA lysidine(34) synthetase TilS [Chloroflexota bacterium]